MVYHIYTCDLCETEIKDINPIIYDVGPNDPPLGYEGLGLCQNCFYNLRMIFKDQYNKTNIKCLKIKINKIQKSYEDKGRCDSCFWFDKDVDVEKSNKNDFVCWRKVRKYSDIEKSKIKSDTWHKRKKCFVPNSEFYDDYLRKKGINK